MELKKEFIQVVDSVENWEQAVRLASNPLLDAKIINENYQEQMIKNIKEMGPYVVLSKDIALPHARPQDGAKSSAIAVLKVKNRVNFTEDKNVNIVIALACSNDDDHLKTLQFISNTLSDKTKYDALVKTNEVNKIFEILN